MEMHREAISICAVRESPLRPMPKNTMTYAGVGCKLTSLSTPEIVRVAFTVQCSVILVSKEHQLNPVLRIMLFMYFSKRGFECHMLQNI